MKLDTEFEWMVIKSVFKILWEGCIRERSLRPLLSLVPIRYQVDDDQPVKIGNVYTITRDISKYRLEKGE